jgi:nucleotide-binding universal stress UspA family protein
LIEVANEIDADLIVIGAHQGDSILEKIIGSTTDRVIRASHTPVLVVKRPVEKAYQQIVVAIDTAGDFDALAPSVNALFPAAGLSLIHVVQIPPQFEAAMLRSGSGESIGVHRDALVDNAKSALRQIAQTLKNFPIRITTKAVVGNPATLLVRATWSPKVDLIVLGPSDRSTGWRALLGSVTRRVLKTATCDVLIFRVDPQQAGE